MLRPQPPMLSEKELRYVQDTDFLQTKHGIIKSMQLLLEQSQQALITEKASLTLPEDVWATAPKISRGENYEGLPYLVLDYPRIFKQETIFAYRTMFWWGHGFSCSLHLAGDYWQHYQKSLSEQLPSLPSADWWVCVNTSPWVYHYRPDNYLLLHDFLQQPDALANLKQAPFMKISRRLPLEHFLELPQFCQSTLRQLTSLLH